MRALILHEHGAIPEMGDFEEPEGGDGQEVVDVSAASLNPVDIAMASGSFYGGATPLGSVVGREGVGRREGGERVYFDTPVAPFGSVAERALVHAEALFPVPDGVADELAVAFGIAGLAAWLSLEWKAQVRDGDTVLVLGASGVVGQIAVQAAKLLGAGHVVAAARSEEGLTRAGELGADAAVKLDSGEDLTEAFRNAAIGGLDVIIDPLWGEPAAAAIRAAGSGARLVQIGQSAGADATIPSSAVRGQAISILGHSNFRAPVEVRRAAYSRMVRHAEAGELHVDVETVKLEDAPAAWERQRGGPKTKLVVVPG